MGVYLPRIMMKHIDHNYFFRLITGNLARIAESYADVVLTKLN